MTYPRQIKKIDKIESYETIIKKDRLRRVDRILNRSELSHQQKNTMKKFYGWLQRKGLRLSSQVSYLSSLSLLYRDMNNVLKPTRQDIDDYLTYLGKEYKPKTQTERRKFLILFYEWFYNKKKDEISLLKDIRIKKDKGVKLPEELLNPEEIKKLVQVSNNFRDKAVIMLLYETAARKGEFLQLKIKHVEIDETNGKKFGYITIPMGKTDSRKIPIIYSLPHVINWLNSHPNRDDSNTPLFITIGSHLGRGLGEDGLKKILKTMIIRAEIDKNIYPHLLRHSRLTELAKELTEQELKIFAGWTPDSNMASVYVHLSGGDISNKILANAGLIDSEIVKKGQEVLRQVVCPTCKALNSSDTKICSCGRILDLKIAQETIEEKEKSEVRLERIEEMLLLMGKNDPRFKKAFLLDKKLKKVKPQA